MMGDHTCSRLARQQFDFILANLDRRMWLDSPASLVARLRGDGTVLEDISVACVAAGGVVRSWQERDGWVALAGAHDSE
ncbi:MAG: hypothetical protein VST65_03770 [Nitrospirota bacterium]|nr:hypothetical protein [Nitrospirota bacterium]